MNEAKLTTLEQVRAFLAGTSAVEALRRFHTVDIRAAESGGGTLA